jgi:hypothetical protein
MEGFTKIVNLLFVSHPFDEFYVSHNGRCSQIQFSNNAIPWIPDNFRNKQRRINPNKELVGKIGLRIVEISWGAGVDVLKREGDASRNLLKIRT